MQHTPCHQRQGEILLPALVGLRQDQLAGVANVGLRFIVDLEAGKSTAQVGKVLQVLSTLGCTVSITPPSGLELPLPKPRKAR
jgi:hypothetical protein